MRLNYEESCRELQKLGILNNRSLPAMPARQSRFDDDVLAVRFFRTQLASLKLENLSLPRTFFGRSYIIGVSFKGSDLSESILCWNDFTGVDFTDADLSGSDLRATHFNGSELQRRLLGQCRSAPISVQ